MVKAPEEAPLLPGLLSFASSQSGFERSFNTLKNYMRMLESLQFSRSSI